MIKLILRLICLALIVTVTFLIISLHSGGEKFRWLGKKIEEKTEDLGKRADDIKDAADKAARGIEKAKNTVKKLTGKE